MNELAQFLAEANDRLTGAVTGSLNASRFGHWVLVQGLHQLASQSQGAPATLRFRYGDGSESRPFPIASVSCRTAAWDERCSPLRIGFVSGRHPALDRWVDFYILRNREPRQFDSSADVDEEVFDRTCLLFRDPSLGEGTCIEAYHTGLEAVTIGVYRAVIFMSEERAREGRKPILLKPLSWHGARVAITSGTDSARKLAQEFSTFLRFDDTRSPGESPRLHWLPERPMLESEHDRLAARGKGQISHPLNQLLERARFQEGPIWTI